MSFDMLLAFSRELGAGNLWTAFFLELLARSGFILALAFLAGFLLRGSPASLRHLVWHGCVLSLLLLPFFMAWLPALEISVQQAAAGPEAASAGPLLSGAAPGLASWGKPLLALYLAVAAALALYTLLGVFRIGLLTRRARPLRGGPWQAALEEFMEEEGMLRRVRLLESDFLRAPVSWGLLRPVILLPAGEDWSAGRIHSVLLHELSHIRRLDWSGHLLCRLACTLYWFNPLVWLAAARLAEEAERACDDAVVLHGKEGSDYAADLLAIARRLGGSRGRWLAEAVAESFLGRRVRAILNSKQPRSGWEEIFLLRGLLVSLALLVVISTVKLVPEVNVAEVNRAFMNLIPVSLPAREKAAAGAALEESSLPRMLPAPAELPVLESYAPPAGGPARTAFAPPPVLGPEELAAPQLDNLGTAEQAASITPLSTASPEYPDQAMRKGIEGYTLVEYNIDEDGRVSNPVIIESSPGSVFDRASLEAIRGYRYRPRLLNGEPVVIQGLRARFIYQLQPKPG